METMLGIIISAILLTVVAFFFGKENQSKSQNTVKAQKERDDNVKALEANTNAMSLSDDDVLERLRRYTKGGEKPKLYIVTPDSTGPSRYADQPYSPPDPDSK